MHGHLKPGNIVVDKFGFVQILFFSHSSVLKDKKSQEENIGTPYYLAPEVFTEPKITEETDSWATGILAYILLCGNPPFMGTSDH